MQHWNVGNTYRKLLATVLCLLERKGLWDINWQRVLITLGLKGHVGLQTEGGCIGSGPLDLMHQVLSAKCKCQCICIVCLWVLVETKQQWCSFMIAHSVPAGSAASTRPRVALNRSLFHFLTSVCVCVYECVCVFMYICVSLGWAGVRWVLC